MDKSNDTTAGGSYNGATPPEQTGTNQSTGDVMDEDVAAIATADDPEVVATEQGSSITEDGLVGVAHLTVSDASKDDAPAEFSRVIVTIESRVEGTVPFDKLSELAIDETVEHVATAEVATKEGGA